MYFSRLKYPASFKMLRSDLLSKAIEIGNSLLKEGYGEQQAELIALSNAKLWNSSLLERTSLEQYVHLVPHPKGWALISQDASIIHFVVETLKDALPRARSYAKNGKTRLYFHSLTGIIRDCESFVVNRPSKDRQPAIQETKSSSKASADSWINRIKENLFDEEGSIEGSLSI